MFPPPRLCNFDTSFGNRYGGSVKVIPLRNPKKIKKCWCEICMGGNNVRRVVRRYTWSADDQWNVDILLVATGLPRLESMLADMKTIVAAVNDVRILHEPVSFQTGEKTINHLVDCLQCAQSLSVEMIVVINICFILLLEFEEPIGSRGLDLKVSLEVEN